MLSFCFHSEYLLLTNTFMTRHLWNELTLWFFFSPWVFHFLKIKITNLNNQYPKMHIMGWQILLPLKRKVTCNKSICISLRQCSGRTRLRDIMKSSEVCPVHRATHSGSNTGELCRQLRAALLLQWGFF